MLNPDMIIITDQYIPTLGIISEEYGPKNVTVSVEWTQQVATMYTVRISPPVPIIIIGSTSRQLIISYNTVYNLSVEATAPCRANATAIIGLHYGEVYSIIYSSACLF